MGVRWTVWRKRTSRSIRFGAAALGALAIGAFAVGALAIGRLAIASLAVYKASLKSLDRHAKSKREETIALEP